MDSAYIPLLIALGICGAVALAGLLAHVYRLYGDSLPNRSARVTCLSCGKRARVSRQSTLVGYQKCKRCNQRILLLNASAPRQRNRLS